MTQNEDKIVYVLKVNRRLLNPVNRLINNVGCRLAYLNRVDFLKSFNFKLGSTVVLPNLLGVLKVVFFIYDHFRTTQIECLVRKGEILFFLEVVLS